MHLSDTNSDEILKGGFREFFFYLSFLWFSSALSIIIHDNGKVKCWWNTSNCRVDTITTYINVSSMHSLRIISWWSSFMKFSVLIWRNIHWTTIDSLTNSNDVLIRLENILRFHLYWRFNSWHQFVWYYCSLHVDYIFYCEFLSDEISQTIRFWLCQQSIHFRQSFYRSSKTTAKSFGDSLGN